MEGNEPQKTNDNEQGDSVLMKSQVAIISPSEQRMSGDDPFPNQPLETPHLRPPGSHRRAESQPINSTQKSSMGGPLFAGTMTPAIDGKDTPSSQVNMGGVNLHRSQTSASAPIRTSGLAAYGNNSFVNGNNSISSIHSNNSYSYGRKRNKGDFTFGETLGEGSYSSVVLATENASGRIFAVKILSKAHIVKEKKIKYVQVEKEVLNRVNHPFVIKLYFTFQDSHSLYFVLEYASNGDLLGFIRRMPPYQVEVARWYTAELTSAVQYLHGKQILHRDIKPENILVDEFMHIRLADFGSAKDLASEMAAAADAQKVEQKKHSFVGTAEYCSPELLNDREASFMSDVWAIGCVFYQLLVTKPPFKGGNEYQTFQKIIHLEYSFPEDFQIPEAEKLIRDILQLDPEKRPGTEAIKQYNFFGGFDWESLHIREPPAMVLKLPDPKEEELLTDEMDSDIAFQFGLQVNMNAQPLIIPKLHQKKTSNQENIILEDVDDTPRSGQDAPQANTSGSKISSRSMNTTNTPYTRSNTPSSKKQASTERPYAITPSTNDGLPPAIAKLLEKQQSTPFFPLLKHRELVLHQGAVLKKKFFGVAKKRFLLITDTPRILFLDADDLTVLKEDVPLGIIIQPNGLARLNASFPRIPLTVEFKNSSHFLLQTPEKKYSLEDPTEHARQWVDTLQSIIDGVNDGTLFKRTWKAI